MAPVHHVVPRRNSDPNRSYLTPEKRIEPQQNIFSHSFNDQVLVESFEVNAKDLNRKVERLERKINKTERQLRKTMYTSQLMRILMLDLLDLA